MNGEGIRLDSSVGGSASCLVMLRANSDARTCVQLSMPIEVHLDTETMERLEKQSGLLLRTYQTEFAQDPTSPATESRAAI